MSTTPSTSRDRLIVALDFDRIAPALALARRLASSVGMFKIGAQLFTAEGPRAVEQVASLGRGIFLDLKFHDIPNTVAGAVRAAAGLPGVRMINVHALGGYSMMAASIRAVSDVRPKPLLLAVTLLTSMDESELDRVGIRGIPETRVIHLARLARMAGLDGVVASARELRALRRLRGKRLTIVVPGVRPKATAWRDQSRVATPAEAIRDGADYLVIGRPITEARDPLAAANAILKEIAGAARRRSPRRA
ncbi:MAG: orotidine-5'-phosphate decarboxylase [Candidatus Acidiferrales bacterium]